MTTTVRIGFTGTQEGMTRQQQQMMTLYLDDQGPHCEFDIVLHHGVCIGADEQAHFIALDLGHPSLVLHPPVNTKKMSRLILSADYKLRGLHSLTDKIQVLDPEPYIDRNHDIVNATTHLYACPKGFKEELRSGTWATIRYAQRKRKPVTIVWPDGKVSHE